MLQQINSAKNPRTLDFASFSEKEALNNAKAVLVETAYPFSEPFSLPSKPPSKQVIR